MITYNELQGFCDTAKISVASLAEELDMSYPGLKTAIEKGSLPIKKVVPLCAFLSISVNQFFHIEAQSGDNVSGYQQKQGKKQIMNFGAQELQQTIEILKDQLKKKDDQIDKLLTRL